MKKQAFTLVELIVVITILAILGTIAFISLQGYSADARDATRLSDIGSMKKGLTLYNLKGNKYPTPSGTLTTITYSGAEVWTQGTFGEEVLKEIKNISNVPLDPLTSTEYAYSVLNTKKEFELGGIMEGGLSKTIGTKANAEGTQIVRSYITGNYNGKVAKAEKDGITYVLAVPTIINANLGNTDLLDIATQNTFAYNGTSILPASFSGTNLKITGNDTDNQVNPSGLEIYSGTGIDGMTNQEFVDGLQSAYTGTTIGSNTEILTILSIDTNNPNEVNNYASNIVNDNLGGNVVVTYTVPGIPQEIDLSGGTPNNVHSTLYNKPSIGFNAVMDTVAYDNNVYSFYWNFNGFKYFLPRTDVGKSYIIYLNFQNIYDMHSVEIYNNYAGARSGKYYLDCSSDGTNYINVGDNYSNQGEKVTHILNRECIKLKLRVSAGTGVGSDNWSGLGRIKIFENQ